MNKLIELMKKIELYIRSKTDFDINLWNELSELSDWEYRIVQDFILRVNIRVEENNLNFVYKDFEHLSIPYSYKKDSNIDLLICTTRRNKNDLILTDVYNKLVVPKELKYTHLDVWGYDIVTARNLCIKKACELGCRYILFVDDDIIAPNNALLNLYNSMSKHKLDCIGAQYYRKVEPLTSAHGKLTYVHDNIYRTDLCAMGFTLINIENISNNVPFPLFHCFGSKDGYWSLGEDAFFSKNLFHYNNQYTYVDLDVECLHYDKKFKNVYGNRKDNLVYANNTINNFDIFENIRVPNEFPLLNICIPKRKENDPVACNLNLLTLLRGYKSNTLTIYGKDVDSARNELVKQAINNNSNYILFLDDDIIPPKDAVCKLLTYMENDKDIAMVGGEYFLKGIPTYSAHLTLNKNGLVTELDRIEDYEKNDLVKCNWLMGMGFTLIRTNIFNKIREPWFMCHLSGINEDAHFTELVLQTGYKVLVDKTVKCLHVDYNNEIVYIDNNVDLNNYCIYDWIKNFKIITK